MSSVMAPQSARERRSFTPRGVAFKAAAMGMAQTPRGDRTADVRTAGKLVPAYEDSTATCMRVDVPRTPDQMKKMKKLTKPGEITVHWGLKDAMIPDPGNGYGTKSVKAENVEQNFKAGQQFGIAEYKNSMGESIYYSTKREPLGKSYSRGHTLPEHVKDDKRPGWLGFGKATQHIEDAKLHIYPRDGPKATKEIKALYKTSHGNFDPGEAMERGYKWPAAVVENPHFRFGLTDVLEPGQLGNGAKNALNTDYEDDSAFPSSPIVKRTAEDYRQVANDHLGASRNMMQGHPPVQPGHAFGIASGQDDCPAGMVMRGWYSHEEQMPDHDLGKCVVAGRRNPQTHHVFGMPTIQNQRAAPKLKSIADPTNYGDEVGACALLRPQRFELRGVSDSEFLVPRSKEEISSLMSGAGYEIPAEDFETIWNAARQDESQSEVNLSDILATHADWVAWKRG